MNIRSLFFASLVSLGLYSGSVFAEGCQVSITGGAPALTVANFDAFATAATTQSYAFTLALSGGECNAAVLRLGDGQGDTGFKPAFSLSSGSSTLFNSASATGNSSDLSLTLSATSTQQSIPLTLTIPGGSVTSPGTHNKSLTIDLVSVNGVAVSGPGQLSTINVSIVTASTLSGGFSGTTAGQFTQSLDLDLGELQKEITSSLGNFTVKSNASYQLTMSSTHQGQLVMSASGSSVPASSLGYALTLDGLNIALSNGSQTVNDRPATPQSGVTHSLWLTVIDDPDLVRAGTYSDTVTIDVQQNL